MVKDRLVTVSAAFVRKLSSCSRLKLSSSCWLSWHTVRVGAGSIDLNLNWWVATPDTAHRTLATTFLQILSLIQNAKKLNHLRMAFAWMGWMDGSPDGVTYKAQLVDHRVETR